MTPYLVTAPTMLPLSLSQMKEHLRVAHDDDDTDILARQEGVVAHLDGQGGVLGRCIMPQTWAVDVTGPGPHVLPFPDASDVAAQSGEDALAVVVTRTALGPSVTVSEAAHDQAVTISAVYSLPEPRRAAAVSLIKLMVERDFNALSGPEYDAFSRSIDNAINALRWRRV